MTVATLAEVLAPAIAGRYAVAGLVVLGYEDAQAFVEAAEAAGAPVILQAGPGARAYMPTPIWGKMFRVLAERASVPVVCHLDHAYTLAECLEGIESGFTSVMIDGSSLDLEANIALTRAVVEAARRAGVGVEGEVGVVGYAGGKASQATTPADAARFEGDSGADALAISIGNLHLSQDRRASVDWVALRAIEAVTRLPLVLHGGSGIPFEARRRLARESRVKKINVGTELRQAFGAALRESVEGKPQAFDRLALLGPTIAPLRAAASRAIENLRGR